MSKMGNLYLELLEKLEKELPGFKEAAECGCKACDYFTIPAIQIEFEKYSKANHIYAGAAKC